MTRFYKILISLLFLEGLRIDKRRTSRIYRSFNRFFFLMILAFFFSAGLHAQHSKVVDALKKLKVDSLDEAKVLIDVASKNDTTKVLAHTWYYKGFIYYELYKRDKNIDGPKRALAIDYFTRSLELDGNGKYSGNSRTQMNNIAITFYNDAVNYIYSNDPEKARNSFDIFLQMAVIGNPAIDLRPKKMDIYNALGGLYTRLYEVNRRANRTYLILAEEYYNKALKIDSLDVNANYNIGILYYNVAVSIINGTDYDIDLVALDDIQDTSLVLFKESLPYMKYALKLDPESEDVLQGLKGIYWALNETERLEEINKRLEELRAKKE
ncbi:MAG TPA: hypothetical protein EYN89_05395 [Flavobacteriales bacterium]|nr:hypothetical protein [Flavobacteriales bacterium]